MVGLTHGRGQVHEVELGARRDGTLVGLRVDILADMGGYPGGAYRMTTKAMPGVCRLPASPPEGGRCTNAVPSPSTGGRDEATPRRDRTRHRPAARLDLDGRTAAAKSSMTHSVHERVG
jgi:carbon-monoxide dehydrogenase large subunit